MRIVFVEKSSLSPEETVSVESESSVVKVAGVDGVEQRQRWLDKARAWFKAVFLPEGFPATNSSDLRKVLAIKSRKGFIQGCGYSRYGHLFGREVALVSSLKNIFIGGGREFHIADVLAHIDRKLD